MRSNSEPKKLLLISSNDENILFDFDCDWDTADILGLNSGELQTMNRDELNAYWRIAICLTGNDLEIAETSIVWLIQNSAVPVTILIRPTALESSASEFTRIAQLVVEACTGGKDWRLVVSRDIIDLPPDIIEDLSTSDGKDLQRIENDGTNAYSSQRLRGRSDSEALDSPGQVQSSFGLVRLRSKPLRLGLAVLVLGEAGLLFIALFVAIAGDAPLDALVFMILGSIGFAVCAFGLVELFTMRRCSRRLASNGKRLSQLTRDYKRASRSIEELSTSVRTLSAAYAIQSKQLLDHSSTRSIPSNSE